MIPKYDELSVVNLISDVMKQPDLAKFLPEQKTKADAPDRIYFFNILNTVEPDYVQSLMKHAQALRFGEKGKDADRNRIEITEEWMKELQASPYYSRKLRHLTIILGHHGSQLMLLKQGSKPANKGFKRKKLDVKGTYQQIKVGGGQGQPRPSSQVMPGGGNTA